MQTLRQGMQTTRQRMQTLRQRMQTTRQRMQNCRQDCGHRTPRDATSTSPIMLLTFQHHKKCCSFHRFVLGGRHTTHIFSSTMIGDTCDRFRVALLDCIELPGRLHLSDHDIDVDFPKSQNSVDTDLSWDHAFFATDQRPSRSVWNNFV